MILALLLMVSTNPIIVRDKVHDTGLYYYWFKNHEICSAMYSNRKKTLWVVDKPYLGHKTEETYFLNKKEAYSFAEKECK